MAPDLECRPEKRMSHPIRPRSLCCSVAAGVAVIVAHVKRSRGGISAPFQRHEVEAHLRRLRRQTLEEKQTPGHRRITSSHTSNAAKGDRHHSACKKRQ